MELFERIGAHHHEQVVFWSDRSAGYKGIIAIHNTVLGPALGGTRFWNYASDDAALTDVLRLSRGMTHKAAVTGLNLGGGKSVIIGDPDKLDRELIFRAHGRAVESLNGRYITAEDVNTSPSDMEYVHAETEHVVGLPGTSGDPSPVTAWGVFHGIQAACKAKFGSGDLSGRSVAVQGLGHVGYHLCRFLAEKGARLVVTDVVQERVQRVVHDFGAQAVGPNDIYAADVDVYAPSALGATINDDTIPVLKAGIVAGAANNVLAEERHGEELRRRGVLYAPDFVINAGGLINVYGEIQGWGEDRAMNKAADIHNTLLQIFERSEREGVPTNIAAIRQAEKRIATVGRLQPSWIDTAA
ncbi:MAG TPA: Glu/Leu/Phe/Val dehydrogenase [Longimicrobium sp.]|nr:Glu/Leu/Phe/Val dehydrogenase [Longimicrobium sp.]